MLNLYLDLFNVNAHPFLPKIVHSESAYYIPVLHPVVLWNANERRNRNDVGPEEVMIWLR